MPSNNTNQNAPRPLGDAELEAVLYQALLRDGLVIPHTPEEVALVSRLRAEEGVELPPELLDPDAVLRGAMKPRPLPAPPSVNPSVVQQLACAARNGGEIPPEVRDRMSRDRDDAEREPGDGRP